MGFSAKQVAALRRNLDQRHVRTRLSNGRELSYIEGWHAIAEANRIFGFDGWSRETLEARCVVGRESRGVWAAVYLAKVRVTVHAQGQMIVREGHGTGEGRGASAGEAHDIGLKAAETDATKRALATFGKRFGLSLYLRRKIRKLGTVTGKKESSAIRPYQPPFPESSGTCPFQEENTLARLPGSGEQQLPLEYLSKQIIAPA